MPVGPGRLRVLSFSASILLTSCSFAFADSPEEQSRALIQRFSEQLQTELKKGLHEGGPVAAIRVCKDRAPQIASQLSRSSGANVRRTSLRYRNPAGAPDDWEAQVLRTFKKRAQSEAGTFVLESINGRPPQRYRYMRAIRVQPVCLSCHGTSLSEQVQTALAKDYPFDLATGYELGDLRGAFSVTWPSAHFETEGGQPRTGLEQASGDGGS